MLNKIREILKSYTRGLVSTLANGTNEIINSFLEGMIRVNRTLLDTINNLWNIAKRDTLFLLVFILICFILGFSATKISEWSLDSTLPGSFIVLTILSQPFFESVIRLYNYSKDDKKKLSSHAIAFFDFLKIFAVNAVLIIVVQKILGTVYASNLEALMGMGGIGFLTLFVTLISYSLLMTLAEKRFISEEDYTEKDSQEAELIKSFRSLTAEQKSEIQQTINTKLDK